MSKHFVQIIWVSIIGWDLVGIVFELEGGGGDISVRGRKIGGERVASGGGGLTEVRLWVGGGGAVSWKKYGCGPRSARYLTRRTVPSDGAYLEIISILESSKKCGFISAQEISAGDRPFWGLPLWFVLFFASVGGSRWLRASEEFMMVLEEGG